MHETLHGVHAVELWGLHSEAVALLQLAAVRGLAQAFA